MVNMFQSIAPGQAVALEVCLGYPLPFDPNDPNTEIVTTVAVAQQQPDVGGSSSSANINNNKTGGGMSRPGSADLLQQQQQQGLGLDLHHHHQDNDNMVHRFDGERNPLATTHTPTNMFNLLFSFFFLLLCCSFRRRIWRCGERWQRWIVFTTKTGISDGANNERCYGIWFHNCR